MFCRPESLVSRIYAKLLVLSLALILTPFTCRAVPMPGNASERETTPYTGCYELNMGRWWPWSFGEDTKYVTPPNRIELLPQLGTQGFEKDRLLIRSIPVQIRVVSGGRRASFWEVRHKNRLNLVWTDGFTGVTLNLEQQGPDLHGWAHPHFDAARLIPRIARAKLQRIPCDAP